MLIVLDPAAPPAIVEALRARLTGAGCSLHETRSDGFPAFGLVGPLRGLTPEELRALPGVRQILPLKEAFKLASREFHPESSIVHVGRVPVGGDAVVLMAGPCSVESREHILEMARLTRAAGAAILRGGAFKPRTSPYAFQGLGEAGLRFLRDAADRHGLLVVSEVMESAQIPLVASYADILQVGARNMQNFNLLRDLGKQRKPVLLKRGISATIEELLLSAEYILAGGNYDVILCERGIRTFETYTRNTMDISAIPVVKKLSHLPIVADPSHGTGRRDKVAPMARAAVAAGADGLLVEVHPDPDHALSDGAQSLAPDQFDELMRQLRVIAQAVERYI
jgi:3-deoxy-7-phosphoheptulonate synthase